MGQKAKPKKAAQKEPSQPLFTEEEKQMIENKDKERIKEHIT